MRGTAYRHVRCLPHALAYVLSPRDDEAHRETESPEGPAEPDPTTAQGAGRRFQVVSCGFKELTASGYLVLTQFFSF